MSNNLRTRNGMPFNFVNGLKVRGMDIESLIPGIEGIPEAGSKYQFAGNGSNKAFTLPVTPYNKDAVDVYVKQLYVHPDDYTLVGDTITLTEAPPAVVAGETYNVVIKVSLTTLNGYVNANRVSFEGENLDVVLQKSKPIANYSTLRAYTGGATQVRITDPGIAGFFYYDAADTSSADNGGTIIVAGNGKRWKRLFDGHVNALWFGAKGDWNGTAGTDNSSYLQTAINFAIVNGKNLHIPAGRYFVTQSLKLIRPSGEYRGDSFRIFGDGAGSLYLSLSICPGTVILTNTDIPIINFPENISGGYNNLYVEHIRLEQINSASLQPIMLLEITAGYSKFSNLEIRQAGTGDGIKILKGYVAAFEFVNIANRDLVSPGAGVSRTGAGIRLVSTQAGGLFTIRKVTCRGFLDGYVLGNGTTGLLSTKMDQCECSVVTNGITVESNMIKTIIDSCYFEGVYGKCIIDKGHTTSITKCFMFDGFSVGLDSTYSTFGNSYKENTIYINGTNSIGIDVYADGDAIGHQKYISANYIYFLASGGTVAGVNGIRITGANPSLSINDNNFRPRRQWIGGAGTVKINNASTGINTGVIPLTDALNEFPLFSSIGLSLAPSGTITQSSVSAGALAVGASSQIEFSPTAAPNVTQINIGNVSGRILLLIINSNATLVDGPYMVLNNSTNFTGPGQMLLNVRVLGGVPYAYEIARTTF